MNFVILLILLATIGLIFLYFSRRNSRKRKENLNIIRKGKKIYFYLSDDYFFSVNLEENSGFSDTISKTISNEIECIRKSVRKISFINFKNDILKDKLNKILQIKRG